MPREMLILILLAVVALMVIVLRLEREQRRQREAVRQVVANPSMLGGITKELYPAIAHKFGTTSSKVERAIRHAIEVAWSRGRVDSLNQAFGCCVVYPEEKPTNGEFIALLADKLSSAEHSA